jgi:hypothetical protein
MYVTVVDYFNKHPTYVVTNDLMRDHRLAFLADHVFVRWRNSLLMNFRFQGWRKPGTLTRNLLRNEPQVHAREIPFANSRRRWHIPATDDISWLCLPTALHDGRPGQQ